MSEKQFIPNENVDSLKLDLLIKNHVETQVNQFLLARIICSIEKTDMPTIESNLSKIRNEMFNDLLATIKARFILTANAEDILKNLFPPNTQ